MTDAPYTIDLPVTLKNGDVMSFSANDAANRHVDRVAITRSNGDVETYRRWDDGWRQIFVH